LSKHKCLLRKKEQTLSKKSRVSEKDQNTKKILSGRNIVC